MNAHIDAPSKFVVHMGCYSSFGAYKDNENHEKKRLLVSDGKLSQLPNPNAWVEFDDFGYYTPNNERTQRVIGLFLANIFSLSHIPKIFSHENRKNQRKCDFSATNDD